MHLLVDLERVEISCMLVIQHVKSVTESVSVRELLEILPLAIL